MSKQHAMTVSDKITALEKQAIEASGDSQALPGDGLIPKLMLMQGTSSLVSTRKVQLGDVVKSTNSQKMGSPEKDLPIIPLKMENYWFEFTTTQPPEFKGKVLRHAANEHLPAYEPYTKNGQEVIRKRAITLFALLPDEVSAYQAESEKLKSSGEMPDLGKIVLPVVITFVGTSFTIGGKKCADFFHRVATAKRDYPSVAPFKYILKLKVKEATKGKNTWFVFDFPSESPQLLKDPVTLEKAAHWVVELSNKIVKIHAEGEEDSGEAIHDISGDV